MLAADAAAALAAHCAPGVAPATLVAIAGVESGLDPYAIGVNGPPARRPRPATADEAAAQARALIARGRDVDLGLAQINARNLPRLGLSLEAAFDPCRNLAAAATVLKEGYARGRDRHGPGQAALRVALSLYNTGHAQRGFANGYVARVLAQAGKPPSRPAYAPADAAVAAPASPPWDVFGRAAAVRARFVISTAGAAP
jgi:type IV secretion system protein VirB1